MFYLQTKANFSKSLLTASEGRVVDFPPNTRAYRGCVHMYVRLNGKEYQTMAGVKRTKSRTDQDHLAAGGIWKGENESDAEQLETFEANPLA